MRSLITTVTTTTTTIITATSLGLLAGIGAFSVAFLVLLLLLREVAHTETKGGRAKPPLRMLASYLSVPVLPLLLVFAVIVVFKVLEAL